MIPPISTAQPASLPVSAPPSTADGKTSEVVKKKLSGAQKRKLRKQNQAEDKQLTASMVARVSKDSYSEAIEQIEKVKAMTLEERQKYQEEVASGLVEQTKISLAHARQKAKVNIERMVATDNSSVEASFASFARVYQGMSKEEKLGQRELMIEGMKATGIEEKEAASRYAALVRMALALNPDKK